MTLKSTNQRLTTYQNTQKAHSLGWSVVPLLGDKSPDNGKSPAINWKQYQKNMPSNQQIDAWFKNKHSAYGIVCGAVSNLCVIDIDDISLVDKLQKKLPFIFDTYTVQTGNRNGLHLYFYVDFKVYSRHLKGIDIKGEGGYVVGPGSTINGKTWKCINSRSPRRLAQDQWEHILATLKQPKTPFNDSTLRTRPKTSINAYKALYRNNIEECGGRNNSLFMVACFMRNDGYDMDTIIQTLADCHANEPPWSDQHQEPYAARYQEGLATIRSAYKQRPVYKAPDEAKETVSQLPNSLREVLLQQPDGMAVLRTIEALQLRGVTAGTKLSLRKAIRILVGIVGEHSVRKAFKALSTDGNFIFPRVYPPSISPQANADRFKEAITEICANEEPPIQPVRLSTGKNRHTKTPTAILMPSIRHLCRIFDIAYSHLSTPLAFEDLQSPKAYRQALHIDLLKRSPGQYSQALLGARIGVCERTIRSYNTELPVRSQRMWYATPLHLFNAHIVPQKADFSLFGGLSIGGHWLQDETGKKYPPFREIAFALWRDGHKAFYCQQTTSYYWVEEFQQPEFTVEQVTQPAILPPPSDIPVKVSPPVVLPVDKPKKKRIPWHKQPLPNPKQEKLAEDIHAHIAKVSISMARKIVVKNNLKSLRRVLQHVRYKIGQGSVNNPKAYFIQSVHNMQKEQQTENTPRTYKRPLASWDKEQAAQQLHTAIPDINIYNARRLVTTYGINETKTALRQVLWLNEKGKVRRPSGFFITTIRLVWVELNGGWGNLASPVPRFRGEARFPETNNNGD